MKKFLLGVIVGAVLTYFGLRYYEGDLELPQSLDVDALKAKAADVVRQAKSQLEDIATPETAPEEVELVRAIDGDTVDVRINGLMERIRYIGADTPEREEPCYDEARRANIALLNSGPLRLDTDETDADDNGRLLRYVYAGDTLIERELIAQGFAEVVMYRSDDKHYDEFRQLEEEAAEQGLGCHPTGIFDDGSMTR